MTLLSGIDPGSRENAIVTLDMSGKRPRLVSWQKVSLDGMCSFVLGCDLLLAIETVEGIAFDPARAADLIRTEGAAREAKGIAIARGLRTECLSGRTWRGGWLGYPTASDKAIRIAVEATVDFSPDLPRIYATDRKHIYDAIGVAVAAAPRFGFQRIVIPPLAVVKIAEEMGDVRKRAAKKAAKKRSATMARKNFLLPDALIQPPKRQRRRRAA